MVVSPFGITYGSTYLRGQLLHFQESDVKGAHQSQWIHNVEVMDGALHFKGFHTLFIREKIDWKDLPHLGLCAICGAGSSSISFFRN